MGILKSGIFGPFRKKVGPGVGRRHMGQDLVSVLPRKSNKPLTEIQLEAQLKFGLLNNFLSNIDVLVNIGFKAYAKRKSPVNAAYSYNSAHAFVKTGDTYVLNYPQMIYSRGRIVTPEGVQAIQTADGIAFSWLTQSQSAYCQFSDLASFLIYNPAKERTIILSHVVNRYALGYTIKIPLDYYLGDTVHCYLSFASANGKLRGNSLYIGEIIVN